MSMVRKFKTAKIQLTMTGDKHPKGVKRTLNNVAEQVSEEQVALLGSAMEILTSEKFTSADLINTQSITFE